MNPHIFGPSNWFNGDTTYWEENDWEEKKSAMFNSELVVSGAYKTSVESQSKQF